VRDHFIPADWILVIDNAWPFYKSYSVLCHIQIELYYGIIILSVDQKSCQGNSLIFIRILNNPNVQRQRNICLSTYLTIFQ
jgi:hypothetical protein